MIVVAHRGASAEAPENTLEAFDLALKQGARFLECDVRKTRDGKIIVIHDEKIDRTTSGKGKVAEYKLEELQEFGIPSLREVLLLVKKKEARIFVEIKEIGIEKKVLAEIKKTGMKRNVVVISFLKESLKKMKLLDKSIKTGFVFLYSFSNKLNIAKNIGAEYALPHFRNVDSKFMKKAKKLELVVFPWTVDDIDIAKKLVKLGLVGIETNRFKIINQALKNL